MMQIDLHGEDRIGARIKIDTFLNDCYKLGEEEVAIIHGVGKGILKKEVLEMLKKDKRVKEFNIDCFNDGCTLVRLNKMIDKKNGLWYNTSQNLRGRL
jgi:dsDNA-specific endonuclease/ATPase MutS2